jgi:chromosome segregation ATPase
MKILKLTAWLSIATALMSCISAGQTGELDTVGRFRAENSLMKNRITLIERENDIFKQENLQYRFNTQQLQARVEKLDLDLSALREKYDVDLTTRENQIRSLEDRIVALQNGYEERIRSMTELNKAIQEKLGKQVTELSEQVALQKRAFSAEKEKIMQESAKKEFSLSEEIVALTKETEVKTAQIESQKMTLAELQAKDDELSARIAQLQRALFQAESEIKRLQPQGAGHSSSVEKRTN